MEKVYKEVLLPPLAKEKLEEAATESSGSTISSFKYFHPIFYTLVDNTLCHYTYKVYTRNLSAAKSYFRDSLHFYTRKTEHWSSILNREYTVSFSINKVKSEIVLIIGLGAAIKTGDGKKNVLFFLEKESFIIEENVEEVFYIVINTLTLKDPVYKAAIKKVQDIIDMAVEEGFRIVYRDFTQEVKNIRQAFTSFDFLFLSQKLQEEYPTLEASIQCSFFEESSLTIPFEEGTEEINVIEVQTEPQDIDLLLLQQEIAELM